MNDNSLSPNNIPEAENLPVPEDFPTDALSDYPEFPFIDASTDDLESVTPTAPSPDQKPGTSAEQTPPDRGSGSSPHGPTPQQGTPSGSGGYPHQAPVTGGAPNGSNTAPQGYPYGNPGHPYGNPGHPYGNAGYPYGSGGYGGSNGYNGSNGYTAPNGYSGSNGYTTPNGYSGSNGYTTPNSYNGYGSYGNVPPIRTDPTGAGTPGNNPNKKSGGWMLALLIAGCILIGSVSGVVIGNLSGRSDKAVLPSESVPGTSAPLRPTEGDKAPVTQPTTATPRETQPLATSSGEQKTLNQIYTENVPAIVGISTRSATSSGAGSGFIISSDGEILTNYHVVEDATDITVSLYDGSNYPATLVGYEAESDIALIKIDANNLPVCAIGNSDNIYVGEQIAAIGNPMGELSYTMTVGYVSAVDRFVNTDGTPINMIQVDAAINPGNSGGPVFNLYGEVIGIATAKYSGTLSGGATLEGLGFAIPINDIVEILNDLRVSGKVPDRAYMGVMVSMLPLDPETYGIDHGVFVQSVDEGGSAYKAGVQANDIILKIGDVELNAYENLQQTLRKYRAGDETSITVYRNGEIITFPIVFDAKPDTAETPVPSEPQYTEPVDPTESTDPGETEDPWEDFPWEEFPWGDFPWGEFGG